MKNIAYLSNCFGSLSHTFMRREIAALNKEGWRVYLYGIRNQISDDLYPEEREMVKSTKYLYPLGLGEMIRANWYFLRNHTKDYFRALKGALFNEETNPKSHLKLLYHFFVAPKLAKEMKEQGVDHIHAHFLNVSSTIAMYSAKLMGISFSFTNHTGSPAPLKDIIGLKTKIEESLFFCTITDYSMKRLEAVSPGASQKGSVVHCGIDMSSFPFQNTSIELKDKNNIAILGLGRMVDFKGFKYSLLAAEILKEQGIGFTWTFIGDGPLLEELKELVFQKKLTDQVRFLGSQPQWRVKEEFGKADMLVVSSITTQAGKMEGLPVTIMEALASGLPVVATKSSGIPELIFPEETGFLVNPEDPQDLADGILKMCEVSLRERCIIKGYKRVEQDFNISHTAKQMISVFKEKLQ